MTRKLNVCLVGVGNIGRAHLEIYESLSENLNLSVVDIDCKQKDTSKNRFFLSVDEAIQNQQFDIFDICTPTHTHFSLIEKIITQTSANIFVEKPFVRKMEEMNKIENLLNLYGKNRIIMCAMVERFFEPFIKMKKWADQTNGPLDCSFVRRTQHPKGWMRNVQYSGGVTFDLGIHDIDLFLWITNDNINELKIIKFTDTQVVLEIKTRSGHKAQMYFGWDIPKNDTIFVINEVEIQSLLKSFSYFSENNTIRVNETSEILKSQRFPNAYQFEIEDMVGSVLGDRKQKISLNDTKKLMQTMKKIEQAVKEFQANEQ